MCGIVGIVNLNKNNVKKSDLLNLQGAIKHRGPDGKGEYIYKNVGIAMRRLSIIDVKGGDQPLYNEDLSISIVGNGEIYNYIELQKELKKKGHKLRTGSDIETIIHAYEEWGYDCFKKFRGMFAIAMFDKNKNLVVIARDRMGEKPLYYTTVNDVLYFSSEIKSLINIPNLDKTINKKAIDLYFHYYYIPEPFTPFNNIHKLNSASYMVVDLDRSSQKITEYWNPSEIKINLKSDPTKAIRREFSKACELTLRSDVPVGIALSGGIDSGSILAFSAPKYRDTMKAFSIGYEGTPQSDERALAMDLASKYNVEFIEHEIKSKDVVKNFVNLVWYCDDPIADIAAQSIFEVNKLARKNGVKVLLGGNGGDEIFWGYPSTVEGLEKNLSKSNLIEKFFNKKTSRFNNPDPISTGKMIEQLCEKDFRKQVGKYNYESVIAVSGSSRKNKINDTLTNLRNLWLKSNVITLGDRLSMASSVELRSPFLDYKLVEVALSSKANIESFNLGQKYYLKKAMNGILPDEVLNRPKKGFTPPVGTWIMAILKKYGHLLSNGFLVKEKILDRKKIKLISNLMKNIPTYTAYQLLVMEVWGRLYVYNEKIK